MQRERVWLPSLLCEGLENNEKEGERGGKGGEERSHRLWLSLFSLSQRSLLRREKERENITRGPPLPPPPPTLQKARQPRKWRRED